MANARRVDRSIAFVSVAVRGEDAERDREEQGDDLRVDHQLERHRQRLLDEVAHRTARRVLVPEVALAREPADVVPVLLEEALVETEVLPELLLLLRGAERDDRRRSGRPEGGGSGGR